MRTELVISHEGTKRRIDGAFDVCGDRKILLAIADQIYRQCRDTTFSFGWVSIYPMVAPETFQAPSTPKGWGE